VTIARLSSRLALALLTLAAAGCRREAAPADARTAVWLDISPAYGDPPRDPGDALALLQAYGSGRLAVRGVSVTFGNVPLVRGYPVAHELMTRLDTGLLRPWRGASSPEERAAPTEATELLEEALGKEPLTILALGPATTVASVLQRQPEVVARVERIILIGGERINADAADTGEPRPHAVPVGADAVSLQVLLDSRAAITLVAPDLSTGIGLDAGDLDRLDQGRGAIKLVVPSARAWLQATTSDTTRTAFPVPALLAVDAAAHPGAMRCEPAMASIPTEPAPAALLVSNEPGARGRRVTWCHTADAGAKERILTDLLRRR
jgi:pyrimidine-specific ribonucleoside hydrolase